MTRREAEKMLEEAGFTAVAKRKHIQWRLNDVVVGLSRHGKWSEREEAAVRRKLHKALKSKRLGESDEKTK